MNNNFHYSVSCQTHSLKLSSREKFVDQTQPTFSGADVFFSRRKQRITIEKDPKLAISEPKQPFGLASPSPAASNSNFFIPATHTKGLIEIDKLAINTFTVNL